MSKPFYRFDRFFRIVPFLVMIMATLEFFRTCVMSTFCPAGLPASVAFVMTVLLGAGLVVYATQGGLDLRRTNPTTELWLLFTGAGVMVVIPGVIIIFASLTFFQHPTLSGIAIVLGLGYAFIDGTLWFARLRYPEHFRGHRKLIASLPAGSSLYRRKNGNLYIKMNHKYHVQVERNPDEKTWFALGSSESFDPNEQVESVYE